MAFSSNYTTFELPLYRLSNRGVRATTTFGPLPLSCNQGQRPEGT